MDDYVFGASPELSEAVRAAREQYRKARANGHGSNPSDGEHQFRPIRFKDIRLNTEPAYLIKGIIPREGLAVVWGPPKCGKSFWVYDVVMHAALGWTYRGRKVKRGVVVYIAAEGERGLAARTEAFRTTLCEDADPDFYLLTTRLDLVADVEQLIADTRAAIGSDTCAAVVVDTLNRTIAGSESRDEDMSAYVKAADRVREAFRAAVIIIHHCGINSERPRGHTSLTGACDAQIAVRRDDDDRIIATVEHMKDGASGDTIVSRLATVDVGDDDDGDAISSCIVEPADDEEIGNGKTKLSDQPKRALDLLTNALAAGGVVPPYSVDIPVGKTCVKESVWRDYCYRGSISEGSQEAQQKAFKRSANLLLAHGLVGKWQEWVWRV